MGPELAGKGAGLNKQTNKQRRSAKAVYQGLRDTMSPAHTEPPKELPGTSGEDGVTTEASERERGRLGDRGRFIARQKAAPHKAPRHPLVKRCSQGGKQESGEGAPTVPSAGGTAARAEGAAGPRGRVGSWTQAQRGAGHSRTAAGQGVRWGRGTEAGSYLLSASSGVPNILALIFLLCFLTATFMASSRSPGTR